MPRERAHILFLLKVLFSVGIVLLMLHAVNLGELKESLWQVDIRWYGLSLLLAVGIQPIRSLRWGLLLWKRGVPLSFGRLLNLYFIGLFFSTFLPTLIGGDVVRGYYLFRYTEERSKAVASILIDRFSGVYALALMSFGASAIHLGKFSDQAIFPAVFLLSLVLLAILSTVLSSRIYFFLLLPLRRFHPSELLQKAERLSEAITMYRREKGLLGIVLLLSMAFNALFIGMVYLLSLSLGWRVPLVDFFAFLPMVILLSMFPLSLAGLGVREGSLAFFMAFLAVPLHEALSLSALWLSVNLFLGLIGAAIYVMRRR